MICGIEVTLKISKEKAIALSKKYKLVISKRDGSQREKTIGNKKNSYLRNGAFNNFKIRTRREGDDYTLLLNGSLHKFYHGHNKGCFGGWELHQAVTSLCKEFKIRPSDATINNIEVSINLPVKFDINKYLRSNLSYHRKKYWVFEDRMFLYKHEDYTVKLYRKDEGLLRFEIKFKSIKKIRESCGIVTLADLNEVTVNKLADELIAEWHEILMRDGVDTYEKDTMPGEERVKLLEFTSSIYKQSYEEKLFKADLKGKQSLRQKSYRLKQDCLYLIQKYGNGDHKQLGNILMDLVNEFKMTWGGDEVDVTNSASLSSGKRDIIHV